MNIKTNNKFLAHIGAFTAVFVAVAAITVPVLADHNNKLALKKRGYINLATGNVIKELIEQKRFAFNPIDGKETASYDNLLWEQNSRGVPWLDTVGRDSKKFGNYFAKKVGYPEGGFHGALDEPDPNFLKYVVDFTIDKAVGKMVTLGMDDLGQASKWYLKAYENLSDNAATKVVKNQKWLAGQIIGQLPSLSSVIHSKLKHDLVPLPICQVKFKDPVTHVWSVIPGVVEGENKLHQKRCIFVSIDGKSIHKTSYFNYLKLVGSTRVKAATEVLHWIRLADFKDTNTPHERYVIGGIDGPAKKPLYVCSRGYFNPRTKKCTGVKKNDDGEWEIVTDTSAANNTADSKSDMRVLHYIKVMNYKKINANPAPPDAVLMISDTEDRSTGRGFCMTVTGASKLVQRLPCSGKLEQKWRMNIFGEFESEAYPKSDKKRCMSPKPFKKGEEFAFAKIDTCTTSAALKKIANTNMGHGVTYSQYFLRREGARESQDKKMLTARLCHRSAPNICAEFSFMEAFTDAGLPYLTKDKNNPKVISGMYWYPYQRNVDAGKLPANIVRLGKHFNRGTGLCRAIQFVRDGEYIYVNGYLARNTKEKFWTCLLYERSKSGTKPKLAADFDILVAGKDKKIPYLDWVGQLGNGVADVKSGYQVFTSRGYNTYSGGFPVCRVRVGGQTLLGFTMASHCYAATGGVGYGEHLIKDRAFDILAVSPSKKGTPQFLPANPHLKNETLEFPQLQVGNTGLCIEGNPDAAKKYWIKATKCKTNAPSKDPQRVFFDYDMGGKTFRIRDWAKKNCLAPTGNKTAKGVVIQSAKCSTNKAHYWNIEGTTDRTWYRIRNEASNKCLNLVKDANKGNFFTQWDCKNEEALQRFQYVN